MVSFHVLFMSVQAPSVHVKEFSLYFCLFDFLIFKCPILTNIIILSIRIKGRISVCVDNVTTLWKP